MDTPQNPNQDPLRENTQCTECGWVGNDRQKTPMDISEGTKELICPRCECNSFYLGTHINDERPLTPPTYWRLNLKSKPGLEHCEATAIIKMRMQEHNALYRMEEVAVYDFTEKNGSTNIFFMHVTQPTALPELLKCLDEPDLIAGFVEDLNDLQFEHVVKQYSLEISAEDYRNEVAHHYNQYVQLVIRKL